MATPSSIFKKTYENYLLQVAQQDLESIKEKLGIVVKGKKAIIPLLGFPYEASAAGVTDSAGKPPSFDISVLLCNYLIQCPDTVPVETDWTAYRDFPDSGPLLVYYSSDVEKPIASYYKGRLKALAAASHGLGGVSQSVEGNYDLSIRFSLLPKIPMLLLFNDADDEFPSNCTLLFKKSADKYLDAECLAIAGAYLSSKLVNT